MYNHRFSACWTLVISTIFMTFLLNHKLSQHAIVSPPAQAVWILITWAMWIASTATLNRALPLLSPKRRCAGADFCTQLQAVFGTT